MARERDRPRPESPAPAGQVEPGNPAEPAPDEAADTPPFGFIDEDWAATIVGLGLLLLALLGIVGEGMVP